MPKICILDARTLGEDVDLNIFQEFGEVIIHDTTAPENVVERIKDCEIVITNKVVLNNSNLQDTTKLKLICVAATGTNNIDLKYAQSKGITVTNVAGYSTNSVVQQTFTMLFYLLGSPAYYDSYVKSGQYAKSSIFTHLDRPFSELHGKTWGIIGLGTIGKTVAGVARQFGSRVIYYSTSGENRSAEYTRVDLTELLKMADIVSIHAPLNERTLNLLDYERLQLMKPSTILINMGRGGIVNEADLARILDEDRIGGAALDVLEREPINRDNPLLKIKKPEKLFITPHIAWASREARNTLVKKIAENIGGFYQGTPRNLQKAHS
ncbi:MAG: D-2-hydroxyacid dehydrogenase [Desulfitobacteriaceae bacterium]|nr:D-2-hydroxyacid dehydrogenase [Desulfitobacteriaceae bacterium]MDD4345934.1 D-2-hydroxyacid dehydrogenase [Desulfitobacteriaceae bacterium]MDD4401042.1 D-2-hydroxyacid dehydrogenase [Desulfitobacteriaceae bacterium]